MTYNVPQHIAITVDRSFRDEDTRRLFDTGRNRHGNTIQKTALRKLDYLDKAAFLSDLQSPPGNHLEALFGDRDGPQSIRINDQDRLCFVWREDGAYDVELTDYHGARAVLPPQARRGGWNIQRFATPPGEVLHEDFLIPLGMSQHALAMKIQVPATRIGEIAHGKRAVTPDTALRLARFFGTSPETWLNLPLAHDLSKAKLKLAAKIEREVEVFSYA